MVLSFIDFIDQQLLLAVLALSCRKSNPDIQQFMIDHGFGHDYTKLESFYIQRCVPCCLFNSKLVIRETSHYPSYSNFKRNGTQKLKYFFSWRFPFDVFCFVPRKLLYIKVSAKCEIITTFKNFFDVIDFWILSALQTRATSSGRRSLTMVLR